MSLGPSLSYLFRAVFFFGCVRISRTRVERGVLDTISCPHFSPRSAAAYAARSCAPFLAGISVALVPAQPRGAYA